MSLCTRKSTELYIYMDFRLQQKSTEKKFCIFVDFRLQRKSTEFVNMNFREKTKIHSNLTMDYHGFPVAEGNPRKNQFFFQIFVDFRRISWIFVRRKSKRAKYVTQSPRYFSLMTTRQWVEKEDQR